MRSVLALMSSILDYAGLYPPASLETGLVVENYARHLSGKGQWLLGRLVWPVGKLSDLGALSDGKAPTVVPPSTEGVWAVTAVTSAVEDPKFVADLEAIVRFNDQHGTEGAPALRIDSLEAKCTGAVGIERALRHLPEDVFPYFEISTDGDPRGTIAALADMDAGAKVRTGGTAASQFPSVQSLGRFISACHHARVPFKATAGLHRALRHFDESTCSEHFGFLNVFLGACLLNARKIDDETLLHILGDTAIENFEFSDSSIGWRGERLTVADIELARSRFAHSFGSCSFGEPIEDLIQLELVTAGSRS